MTAISAQVLLRSKSGARVRGDVPITSANIAEYAPSAEDAAAAREAFRAAGFDAGEVVGISFSITAPRARFERFFDVTLRVAQDGAVTVSVPGGEARTGEAAFELPLTAVPASLAALLVTVTFTPPADLHGPSSRGALNY